MTLLDTAPHFSAYLLTYLVHSTVILSSAWLLLARLRVPSSPELRVLAWKLALLTPCLTAIAATRFAWLPFGPELVLTDLATTTNEPGFHSVELELKSRPAGAPGVDAERAPRLFAGETKDISQSPGVTVADAEDAATGDVVAPYGMKRRSWVLWGASIWALLATLGLLRLVADWNHLRRLLRNAAPLNSSSLQGSLLRLRNRMRIRQNVLLFSSPQIRSPLTAGIRNPFIMFPAGLHSREQPFTQAEYEAILAHELAHIAHRDAWWNLLLQFVCRVWFFQPLNFVAAREIRQQMDFVADASAAFLLGERAALVRSLVRIAESQRDSAARRPAPAALVSGMAVFESSLGQRVERLLDDRRSMAPPSVARRVALTVCLTLAVAVVALLAPRAVGATASDLPLNEPASSTIEKDNVMNKTLASLMVITGVSFPAAADEPIEERQPAVQAEAVPLKTTPDELPAGIRGFNGMLVGRIAAKDAETGTFTVRVDAVARVWENSRAEDPRSITGKTVNVSGVFGKFLDVLVVTRIGETVEFECKFEDGNLVFPGELLRKVAPYDPRDYPVLPDEFRGFKGQVVAKVVKKDPEGFEVLLRVEQVRETWEGNRCKNAKSIEGKSLILAGFWNRRETYHALKVDQKIEVGMHHRTLRSDHLTVIEGVRAIEEDQEPSEGDEAQAGTRAMKRESDNPQRGFRGMLVGRLVQKDIERGTFTVTVDAVPRVWEDNRSERPKALIGTNVTIDGVSGRLIDSLVVVRTGETLEFGALYEDGPNIHVGEVLHKVAPVKPGDYPVLPDDFRGFRGMATGKIIRKSDEVYELVVEIERVHETFEESQAQDSNSIIGKRLMLGGFWNRQDEYRDLRVGDTIRCGMRHNQPLSDHLDVVESLQKLDRE